MLVHAYTMVYHKDLITSIEQKYYRKLWYIIENDYMLLHGEG